MALVAEMEKAIKEGRKKMPPTGTEPPAEATAKPIGAPHEQPPIQTEPVAPPSRPAAKNDVPPVAFPRSESPRPWYRNPTGWTLVGGGFAVLAVGAGLLGYGFDLSGRVPGAATLDEQRSLLDQSVTMKGAGGALLGLGGAALVAGSVVLGLAARRASNRMTLLFVPCSDGAMLSLGGSM